MTRPQRFAAARSTVAVLCASTVLSTCSIYNPFGGKQSGYVAPAEVGKGDCSTEVVNLSSRPLEVYFFLGLRNPPRVTAGWPRLGVLEPGQSSVIHGDCERRRTTVHAYATSPVDLSREYPDIRRGIALVKGRREVIRLRLVR